MGIDLSLLTAGIELASAIKEHLGAEKPSGRNHALGDNLSKALRTLYFTPGGILTFLKQVAEQRPVSRQDIEKALVEFNDKEPRVERALESLNFDELKGELRLNLATIRMLDLVRYGKRDLRREIQDEINFYGQRGRHPNPENVAALIAKIEELNNVIEEVEMLVNSRSRMP